MRRPDGSPVRELNLQRYVSKKKMHDLGIKPKSTDPARAGLFRLDLQQVLEIKQMQTWGRTQIFNLE